MDSKTCAKCVIKKELSDFNKRTKSRDGLQPYCRVCNSAASSNWSKENHEQYKETKRNYERKRRAADPSFRISKNLTSLLSQCLRKKRQTSILEKNLDCSLSVFYSWIEYNFTDEMTWSNYGLYWEIDHVLCKSHFDHTNEEELMLVWNFRNLRPVTIAENREKRNKINYSLYYRQVSLAADFLAANNQDFLDEEDFHDSESDSEIDSDFNDEMELFD